MLFIMINEKENFEFGETFWTTRLFSACVMTLLVSASISYFIVKIGLDSSNQKIRSVEEDAISIGAKIDAFNKDLTQIESEINDIKNDIKLSKEKFSYWYTSISKLQNVITKIQEKIGIDEIQIDKKLENISPEKREFIDSFENLIKDGAPFDSYLESNDGKIDIKKYQSSEDLLKLSNQKVKSLNDLKKDYISVGNSIFQQNFEESFWERQKRKITEKIKNAIKIEKIDEKSERMIFSDMENYEKAGKLIDDAKYADAIDLLEQIKIDNETLGNFIIDLKKRKYLEDVFYKFKQEYIDIETASQTIN